MDAAMLRADAEGLPAALEAFHATQASLKAAQHDRQRFYVEHFEDWREMDDDTVELLVH